jgi:2-aminoadipate transaminase
VGIDWERLQARRAANVRSSVTFKFGEPAEVPGTIPFAGGAPPANLLPMKRMAEATAHAWQTADPSVMYYDEYQGYEPLRQLIAERMGRRGTHVSSDDILITHGSQQGLELIAKLFLDPGDRVIIEAPTYFGATQIFEVYQSEFVPVPLDDGGIVISALEAALQSQPKPKFMYLIPTFQNPTGISLDPERRKQVIELSRRYGVPIVEDDPYGELWFRGGDHGTLRQFGAEVIYHGTFSKTMAPALRMGWMVAPSSLVTRFTYAKEGVDIQSDRIVQRAMVYACEDGWLDEHIAEARIEYRERCDFMLECLEREMPRGTRWTEPDGGFFIWVTLPDGANADELLLECAQTGATYNPGSCFYTDWEPKPTLRLGFSTLSRDEMREGLKRMGAVFRQHLE